MPPRVLPGLRARARRLCAPSKGALPAEPALQGGTERAPGPLRSFGFTLIEVLVALAISGIVVLLAHRLFATAGDAGRALRAAREALDREANARRWLAATFLSLDVGTDGDESFDGHPDRVAFSAWQLTADGWFERRRVALGRTTDRVVAELAPGGPLALADGVTSLDFDYLLEPGAESHWVRQWISPVSAPIVVRMRIERTGSGKTEAGVVVDTLLFLIKERG